MTIESLKEYKLVSTKRAIEVFPNASKLAHSTNIKSTECLGNAYNIGKKTKAKIVEGIVLVCVDDKPHGVFGHCWNKIDSTHFDFTLDFAQPIAVSMIPGEKSFKYFEMVENSPRKYYKKAADRNLSWFTESIKFGQFLKDLGSEKLSELFCC
ncbi:MAG: hypothetical protein ACRYFV_22250 [Janthinobacterium lividum]